MKKTVKISLILCSVLVVYIIVSAVVLGFSKTNSIYINDYSVSDDGKTMTFSIINSSSMGHVRGYKDSPVSNNDHRLSFYSCWGGFNSSIGAKDTFTLKLDEDDTEIYLYHGDDYALTLIKDPQTGIWYKSAGTIQVAE